MTTEPADPAPPAVLHVVLSLNPGGTERMVIEMALRQAPALKVAVCCLDTAGAWADNLARRGIEVLALGRKPGFRPSLARRIAGVARARQVAVLHCHQYSPFVYGSLAALLLPRATRLVYTEHGRTSGERPTLKRRLVNPLLARRSCRICAVSAELRDYMASAGFPRKGVRVVRNGIEVSDVPGPEARCRARRTLGLPPDALVIGTVARLDPVKDLATLIHAFCASGVARDGAYLVIVGDGPERASLEALTRQLPAGRNVVFAGERLDARALYPAFDVYANTSVSEGISVTILEAMAAALPVVGTSVGGTPEIVVEGQTGLLSPAADPRSFAARLDQFADRAVRSACGTAGRDRVVAEFNVQRMLEDYRVLYGQAGKAEGL